MRYSLGICIPVWNRGEIFRIAFDSLLAQLEGIEATIWLFDNGSDPATRRIVEEIRSDVHRIHKVMLPRNMGVPYVANLFAMAVQEDCEFAQYRSPSYVMIMDSDAYFKAPIKDLLDLHNIWYGIGLLSGHDSLEHPAIETKEVELNGKRVLMKRKENERMITMIMRKEEFAMCHPFPHYRDRDVDWELTQWNAHSMLRRGRFICVACGYVLHLGIASSTWSGGVDRHASPEEIREVREILRHNSAAVPSSAGNT